MLFSELMEGMAYDDGELRRDGAFEVWDYCTAETQAPFLSFLEREKFISRMSPYVKCVFCTEEMVSKLPAFVEGICVVTEPKKAFHLVHNYFALQKKKEGATRMGENCRISDQAVIAPEGVVIGNDVIIEPHVIIGSGVTIGNHVIIRAGAVIGGQSFSKVRCRDGSLLGLTDMGKTIIEDQVEIYPMVHIANGILPSDVTRIGRNVAIDAQGYIGHGVHIGESTQIAAQVSIGGNTHIGKRVWVGIGATISNRISIADDGRVSLGAVVTRNVAKGQTVSGNFAIEHQRFLENLKETIKNPQEHLSAFHS